MDKKLQLIRHLYGEADDRSELRDLLSDEDLNAEYQELSEAKFWLDHTSHERPDRNVLNAIFEAAAEASPAAEASDQHRPHLNNARPAQKRVLDTLRPLPPSHRSDREPIARQQRKRRNLFKPVATVLMLLVTVSVGYQFWQSQGASMVANQELSATSDLDAQSKSLAPTAERRALGLEAKEEGLVADDALFDREAQPNAPAAVLGEASRLQLASSSAADTSLPEWDDDLDKILRYQRRIDMLLEQNQDLGWDEAAVPLEMLPSGRPANPSLLQAGSRQTNSGNR